MAIIIDMDMPKSCKECTFRVSDEYDYTNICAARETKPWGIDYTDKRAEWCPLQETAPVVHGRWILSTDMTYN